MPCYKIIGCIHNLKYMDGICLLTKATLLQWMAGYSAETDIYWTSSAFKISIRLEKNLRHPYAHGLKLRGLFVTSGKKLCTNVKGAN